MTFCFFWTGSPVAVLASEPTTTFILPAIADMECGCVEAGSGVGPKAKATPERPEIATVRPSTFNRTFMALFLRFRGANRDQPDDPRVRPGVCTTAVREQALWAIEGRRPLPRSPPPSYRFDNFASVS